MKGPPASLSIEAVPSRTILPSAVVGRDVPGRAPAIAPSTPAVEPGRAAPVPGRAKPLSGLPLADMGRMPCPGTPGAPTCAMGRVSEVPGRGSVAVEFSSSRTSATPSSSKSVSSTQLTMVRARHLRYHTACAATQAAGRREARRRRRRPSG
jgi:hypothetical protein